MPFQKRLEKVMGLASGLHSIETYSECKGLETNGIYAFWWIGDPSHLDQLNREVLLKGKKKTKYECESESFDFEDYHTHRVVWERNLSNEMPTCLYVGKSHNIKKRVKLHLEENTLSSNWYSEERWYRKQAITRIEEQYLVKRTTACQLRAGIEHLYKNFPEVLLEDKLKNIGYTFIDEADFKERFYLEDLAIGYFSPWFNLDCER